MHRWRRAQSYCFLEPVCGRAHVCTKGLRGRGQNQGQRRPETEDLLISVLFHENANFVASY